MMIIGQIPIHSGPIGPNLYVLTF